MIPNVLTIAGSDPSGGAGVQADLKTFAALRVNGCAAVTTLTAQNTRIVSGVYPVAPDVVEAQIEAVLADVDIAAVKIGMLGTAAIVSSIAMVLRRFQPPNIVIDPVLRSSTGTGLLKDDALEVFRRELLPLATVLTPNADEAGALIGAKAPRSVAEARTVARTLHGMGAQNVLVTGGHVTPNAPKCVDVLDDGSTVQELQVQRVMAADTHGTGCVLSSAIAAHLAMGAAVPDACRAAQQFVAAAIAARGELSAGHGRKPVHPLHELWRNRQE